MLVLSAKVEQSVVNSDLYGLGNRLQSTEAGESTGLAYAFESTGTMIARILPQNARLHGTFGFQVKILPSNLILISACGGCGGAGNETGSKQKRAFTLPQ